MEVAETARIPAAQQHNANECELFGELLSVLDFRDVLFDALTRPELHSLRLDTLSRGWVDSYLERYEFSIRPVDMASGASTVNVRASTCRCCVASARSRGAHRAARGAYDLAFANGVGLLRIVAGVTIVGQEGVLLTGMPGWWWCPRACASSR